MDRLRAGSAVEPLGIVWGNELELLAAAGATTVCLSGAAGTEESIPSATDAIDVRHSGQFFLRAIQDKPHAVWKRCAQGSVSAVSIMLSRQIAQIMSPTLGLLATAAPGKRYSTLAAEMLGLARMGLVEH
jgi:hypothetical protein